MLRVHAYRWGVGAAYVLVIYLTLPLTPLLVRWTIHHIGWTAYRWGVTLFLGLVLASALIGLVRQIPRLSGWGLGVGAVSLEFAALIVAWPALTPAEKLHLLEYGGLSWLIQEALPRDMAPGAQACWTLGIVCVVGTGDEGLQWLLPNRVFEWKDVGLNIVSGAIGLGVLRAGRSRPMRRELADEAVVVR